MSEPLNSCSIAAAMTAAELGGDVPLAAFRGQMAAVYLFDCALSAGDPAYARGLHTTRSNAVKCLVVMQKAQVSTTQELQHHTSLYDCIIIRACMTMSCSVGTLLSSQRAHVQLRKSFYVPLDLTLVWCPCRASSGAASVGTGLSVHLLCCRILCSPGAGWSGSGGHH